MMVQVRRFSRHRESSPATFSRAFFSPRRRENSEKVRGHDNKQPAVPSSIRFSEFLLVETFSFRRHLSSLENSFLFHYYCFIEKRGINNTFFILFYEEFLKIDDGTIGLECRRINCSVNREIHR